MEMDTTAWTGEGSFTPVLAEALKGIETIEWLRIEDAPASRADAGWAFISNEIYVRFRIDPTTMPTPGFRWPWQSKPAAPGPLMTMEELAARLGGIEGIGEPDYADQGMLQYLRAERIVAPYQTKGCKVVEMVRIYEAGMPPRRDA
jgi:hypothetical protein